MLFECDLIACKYSTKVPVVMKVVVVVVIEDAEVQMKGFH